MKTLQGCKLIVRAGETANQVFDLNNEEITIGRDPTSDIQINGIDADTLDTIVVFSALDPPMFSTDILISKTCP